MRKILSAFFLAAAVLSVSLSAQQSYDAPPTGYFYIKSVQAGNGNMGYWDQPGVNAKFKNGANIAVYANDRGIDQRFRFADAGGGWYYMVSENGGFVDVSGGKNGDGVNIQVWGQNGSISQKFRFRHLGNGRWKIYTSWGRAICLAGRSHANNSNVHTWGDHEGAWMEWYFINAANGKTYIPAAAEEKKGISGKILFRNFNSSGKEYKASPESVDVEVWCFNPSDPKNMYVLKKTVRTRSGGQFDLGDEFDSESSVFLLSKSADRSSGSVKIDPQNKKTGIINFYSEVYDADNYILVDTYFRGKQYYYLDKGYFYLQNGIVTKGGDFFFPRLTSINKTNPASAGLLREIKSGPAALNDSEIAVRLEAVFQLLRTKTKNSMGTKDQTVIDADTYLFSACRNSPKSALNRWPTFDEYAAVFEKYGFIPTANCTSWSHLTATLMYAAGIPADKFFVAKFNYDMSWIVEHWVIALNIGNRWYSIDPQLCSVLRFDTMAGFKNPRFDREVKNYDYKKPFEVYILPGSTISRVPFLGNPDELNSLLEASRKPVFFIKNRTFKYRSGTMVSSSEGKAVVKAVKGSDVTLEITAVCTGEGPNGMEKKNIKFTVVLTHKRNGEYTSGTDYVHAGKVSSDGKSLSMSADQSVMTFTIE